MAVHHFQAFTLGRQVGATAVARHDDGGQGDGKIMVAVPGCPLIDRALIGFADVGYVLACGEVQRRETVGGVTGIV